jgi:outer membrane receptor protein involved in Fe transport
MNKNDATILDAATEKEPVAFLKTKYAMTPIATAVVAALSPGNPAIAQDADEEDFAIEEIIVTATKRAMALQDVPQSIQAFSQADIEKMVMKNMEDYARAAPSVTLTADMPGKNVLTMRGLSTASRDWRTESRVAVYLDEQPVTSISNQLDPRAVDIERIEIMPGPQGTLLGSSSQSGAMRIITNKPNFDGVSGSVTASVSETSGGDPSFNVEGVYNLPLIDDKLAVRVVAYKSRDGGYVDNVLAETPAAQPSWITGRTDNSEFAKDNQNVSAVAGGRIAALWNINDDWKVDFGVIAQETKADGTWMSDDALGDYKTARFYDEFRDDEWWQVSATFTGDLGFAQFVSTTSYFERDTAYEFDNIYYNQWQTAYFGVAYGTDVIDNYAIYYPNYTPWGAYFSLRYHWEYEWGHIYNQSAQERFAQEFRLTSTGDSKLQWMVGAFYEDVYDTWLYGSIMPNLTETIGWEWANYWSCYYAAMPGADNWNCPIPDTDITYVNNYKNWNEQFAVFGEIDYSLTDDLVLSLGGRWYKVDQEKWQNYEAPKGMIPVGTYGADWYQSDYGSKGSDDGTLFKVSLKYNIDDDIMVYGTRSEGFRLGGTNAQKAVNTGLVPENYKADILTNYEVGLKSEWLDNRLQLNVAAYRMVYDDAQVYAQPDPIDDSRSVPWWLGGYFNLGKADLEGLELNGSWLVTRNFKLDFSASFGKSEFKEDQWLDPSRADETDPYFRAGSAMPNAPRQKYFLAAEYTFPRFMDLNADLYMRYDWFYSGSILRQPDGDDTWSPYFYALDQSVPPPDYKLPSWQTSNFQVGMDFDNDLSVALFVKNIWNDKASGWATSFRWWLHSENVWTALPNPQNLFVQEHVLQRPRTIMLQVTKKF